MKRFNVFVFACAITSGGVSRTSENLHFRLHAYVGTTTYHTDFYFNNNSTLGADSGYDAAVFGNGIAPSTAIYSKLVQGYPNIDFIIQSLPVWVLNSDEVVSLGINVPQGAQVTVSMWESNLPSDSQVYLEDNVTNTFTLLTHDNYVFTPSVTLSSAGRFFLHCSQETLSTSESMSEPLDIVSTTSSRHIVIKGQLKEKTTVSIYDIQGRQVLTSHLETSTNRNAINVSFLNTVVYIGKLNNNTQQKTQKVVLK